MKFESQNRTSPSPSSLWRQSVLWFLRLPPASRLLWAVLLIAFLFLAEFFGDLKSPADTPWFTDLVSGRRHTFKTYLNVGLWHGTAIHLVLLAGLLASVRWWSRNGVATFDVALDEARPIRPKLFWILLLILCFSAGAVRWPKMSLSYWGDEGWAVAPYVYGKHVPLNPDLPQGELVFKPVSWLNTAFDDRTCGNHYLFSLAQRSCLTLWRGLHNLPPDAFDETISRLPPFAAGIASLAALALLLRWLGRPVAGLAGALMLSLHPWHLRYSTEARGYTLMLLFLILAVWMALLAMRSGRWRWWLAFGLAEFLCMYSWKGVMYPLAAFNLALLAWIWRGRTLPPPHPGTARRSAAFWRWLVATVIAAGLFINLVYPCLLQVKDAKKHLIQLSGRPMGTIWLHNSLSGALSGMFWHVEEKENPTEVVLDRQLKLQPARTSLELAATLSLLALGFLSLARRHRWHASIIVAVTASSALGALSFRYLVGAEWIYWYFFFLTLPFAFLTGIGIDALVRRAAPLWSPRPALSLPLTRPRLLSAVLCSLLAVALPSAYADLTRPVSLLMTRQAYEDHRGAFLATRGRHEPLHQKSPSNVWTVYLWRYISLYDPRGDTHVRTAAALRALIREVEAARGELYVIVGHRRMSQKLNEGIMNMLQPSGPFEHLQTFWAPEELHCLYCYRYKPAPSSPPPSAAPR